MKCNFMRIFLEKSSINYSHPTMPNILEHAYFTPLSPCRVGLEVSVSASHTVGREFAPRPGHTKDHHKNGTNYLPALHAMR